MANGKYDAADLSGSNYGGLKIFNAQETFNKDSKDARIAELEAQLKTANESNPFLGIKPVLQEYRSGGFVNHAPDMGRISFDMPIIDARVIFNSLTGEGNEAI